MNKYESFGFIRGLKGKTVLITGGAGFIGINLADTFLASGWNVLIYDNLSRAGVEQNLQWLRQVHGDHVQVEIADVRDRAGLARAIAFADYVFHLAAQVAVTTSLDDPVHDFEVNIGGTINLLEAIRSRPNPPSLVYTSTNKVYGGLHGLFLRKDGTRYEPDGVPAHAAGVNESQPLDFRSPYGCSKGAADQYVLDYARTYRIPAAVFRMSCIYGPHQMGTEDQGWVAHFLISVLNDRPLTIYGDGMQVRDILYVDDLIDAFLLAQKNIKVTSGQAFNIGGEPMNAISLIELIAIIDELRGRRTECRLADWRTGDQKYYVSDSGKFRSLTGWRPRTTARDGIIKLYQWLLHSRELACTRHWGQEGVRA